MAVNGAEERLTQFQIELAETVKKRLEDCQLKADQKLDADRTLNAAFSQSPPEEEPEINGEIKALKDRKENIESSVTEQGKKPEPENSGGGGYYKPTGDFSYYGLGSMGGGAVVAVGEILGKPAGQVLAWTYHQIQDKIEASAETKEQAKKENSSDEKPPGQPGQPGQPGVIIKPIKPKKPKFNPNPS